ncbi:MAG: hypothetical protein IPJ69_14425 [Deltaproteobacteria bacterium]|nr:MAG: hypothetical protein IPJ69_14425 [Deltaproteobacteria bacterium]
MVSTQQNTAYKLPLEPGKTLHKALTRLQETWGFTNAEMAKTLHLKANTYGNWIKSGEIPVGKPPYAPEIEILVTLIAIFRSLGSMFQKFSDQVLWLETPHPHFQKASPLQFAQATCENLFYLRHYLDYARSRGA